MLYIDSCKKITDKGGCVVVEILITFLRRFGTLGQLQVSMHLPCHRDSNYQHVFQNDGQLASTI